MAEQPSAWASDHASGLEQLARAALLSTDADLALLAVRHHGWHEEEELSGRPVIAAGSGLTAVKLAELSSSKLPVDTEDGAAQPFLPCRGCNSYLADGAPEILCAAAAARAKGIGLSSFHGLPLYDGHVCHGYLMVGVSGSQKPVSSADALLLKAFTDMACTIIKGQMVSEEAKRRSNEIRAIQEIGYEISALRSLNSVLRLICRKAADLLSAQIAYIALADHDQSEIRMRMTYGIRNPQWTNLRISYGEGVGGVVAQKRYPIRISNYGSHVHYTHKYIREMVMNEGIQAVICVPMAVGNQLTGVLYAADRRPARFSSHHVRLLEGLANQAAIAIDNSRLYEHEHREAEIHERLTSLVLDEADYSEIANVLSELFENPVALYDADHRAVVHSKADLNDQCEAELVAFDHLRRGKDESSELGTLLARMEYKRESFVLKRTDHQELGMDQIVAPAVMGRENLGYVHVLAAKRQIEEFDIRVAERAGVILALKMMRERVAAEVEQRLRGDLLDDLLSESSTTAEAALRRASHLGHDLAGPHLALVVDIRDFRFLIEEKGWSEEEVIEIRQRLFRNVRQAVESVGANAIINLRSGRVVGLLRCSEQLGACEDLLSNLRGALLPIFSRDLPDVPVTVGVGASGEGVASFRRSYEEALTCVSISNAMQISEAFVFYESLGAASLLYDALNDARLGSFLNSEIGALVQYDAEHRSELIKTLRTYLDLSCCKSDTARALHVHLNTLRYRLDQIESLSGMDLSDPEVRFKAHLATRLEHIQRTLSGPPSVSG